MSTPVPPGVIRALAGHPSVGVREEAMVLATVDVDGSPRLTLLSRAELDADRSAIRLTLAGSTTPANLARTGRATLLVIAGETAHTCVLHVTRTLEEGSMQGYEMQLIAHRGDSVGIELSPIVFVTSPELPSAERWETSRLLLARLRESGTDAEGR